MHKGNIEIDCREGYRTSSYEPSCLHVGIIIVVRLLVVPGILSDSLRDSAKASTLLTVQLDCAAPPGADFDPYALPGKEEITNVT